MKFAPAAVAALALLTASPALADPTGWCLWTGLSPTDQATVSFVVMQGGDMEQALAERVNAAARGCGFEADQHGDYRASFLLGVTVHRLQAERTLAATGNLTAARLDEMWRTLDPSWKNSLRAFVISRYQRRDVPLPDAQRMNQLASQLQLSGEGVNALRNYLLLRATIDYVESEGRAFRPRDVPAAEQGAETPPAAG